MVGLVYQVVLILVDLRQLLLLYFTVRVAALKDRFTGSVLLLLLIEHGRQCFAPKYDIAAMVVLALTCLGPDVLHHRARLTVRQDLLYLL